MRRVFVALAIILITLFIDKNLSAQVGDVFRGDMQDFGGGITFVFFGILVGSIYWLRFGSTYSHLDIQKKKKNTFSVYNSIPGKKYFRKALEFVWIYIGPTRLGRYLKSIYSEPVESEHVLGGFFFGKTMIITAIAFYSVDTMTLLFILMFSTLFDSLTGVYQQTLMNFFHRTKWNNKVLALTQNFVKRYIIDIFRAEVITLFLMGIGTFTFTEQFHILKNRFVSSSYYFNAILIDRLVEMGVITRNFRSKFVIYASTGGGMLCLLDFAKTEFPAWVPPEVVQSVPTWMPGPLQLLAIFNFTVFVVAGGTYLIAVAKKRRYFEVNIVPFLNNILSALRKLS